MNERKKNKELIERMAETLRNHTEAYKEGAWEQFSAKHGIPPKRTTIKWPYWAAAAVLLITAGVFLFDGQQSENPEMLVQRDVELPHTTRIADVDGLIAQTESDTAPAVEEGEQPMAVAKLAEGNDVGETAMRPRHTDVDGKSPDLKSEQLVAAVLETEQLDLTSQQTGRSANVLAITVAAQDSLPDNADLLAGGIVKSDTVAGTDLMLTKESEQRVLIAGVANNGLADQNGLNNEYVGTDAQGKQTIKKWDLGLVISPTLTSERVNMGGGVAVAYRLSDKFSLGSGVSIGELDVAQRRQRGGPLYANSSNDISHGFLNNLSPQYKEITSVTSNILAIDVPLDLKYNVTEKFYTSVGVSFLSILSEQRTNHFVDRINRPTFEGSNAGNADLQYAMRAVYSSEKAVRQPLEGRGYTGFLNFSLGRTMPLSRKLQLSVEPYFKLPIGGLSREDMNFTNGGIRIITGF